MIEYLVNKLKPYQYISFDIFDTLMFRTVLHYTDVFDIVELRYNSLHQDSPIANFKKQRIFAEKKARQESKGKEVTLDSIYHNMPYVPQECSQLKEMECNIEIENCVPNSLMIEFLNLCKESGKCILITTDMYLPRNILEKILMKIGVSYDSLFISNEEGVTKRSGELFAVVLKKMGISGSELAHIGDDLNNDIAQPQKYGIAAFMRMQNELIPVPYAGSNDLKSITGNHLNVFLQRSLQKYTDTTEAIIGYSILGPLMWEFCEWVHEQKVKQKLDRLLFVAREGWLIEKCYLLMYPEDKELVGYFRLNKNLLRLPALYGENLVEKFIRSIPSRPTVTWLDIMEYLAVENHEGFISKLKMKFTDYDFNKLIKRHELLFDDKIHDIINYSVELQKKEILFQRSMLKKYLIEQGVTSEHIGLINNSINGSGQSLCEQIMGNNNMSYNIYGLQFVRSKKCISLLENRSEGWLNARMMPSFKTMKFVEMSLILEHLLFETQGTALKFSLTTEGNVTVICDKPRKEQLNFKKIESVQHYVLKFIDDYKNNLSLPLNGWGFKRYMRLLLNPQKMEAFFLGTIWDDDVEEDRQILNIHDTFKKRNCLLKDMPSRTEWIEGWLAINDVSKVYKQITFVRQWLKYTMYNLRSSSKNYC